MEKIGIVEMLKSAGRIELEDLDSLQARQLGPQLADPAARKVIAVKVEGKPPRKPRSQNPPGTMGRPRKDDSELCEAMFDTLQSEGPMYSGQVAARLIVRGIQVSTAKINSSAKRSPWFAKGKDGKWCVALAGGQDSG